jgi:ubiquinone/menaquinone biosynthesis C-methylase UbiE
MGLVHPGPPEAFTLELINKYNIRQFVETGTFMGKTAVWASQHFQTVHTIEASLDLYQNCKKNYGNVKNINFIMGDSKRKLAEIIRELKEPAIFWLDAHYSGEETFGIGNECPLLDEIDAVNNSEMENFILIDDARIFLAPPPPPHDTNQWPDINTVLNLLNQDGRRYSIIFDDVILSVPGIAKDFVANYYQNTLTVQTVKEEVNKPVAEAVIKETEPKTIDIIKEIIEKKLWKEGKPLRLHLGCGEQHFDGYINIDYPPSEHDIMKVKADIFADITKLNLPDNSVDEIRLHHVFEHFSRVGALALLIRWHRWLKTGGKLYIETPDFEGSAKTFLTTKKWNVKTGIIRHLAGDQVNSWAYHIDNWFPERFERTLKMLGFDKVETKAESWRHEPYLGNVHAIGTKTREMSIEELLIAGDEILWESTVADSEKPSHEAWKKQLREIIYHNAEMPKPSNNLSDFKFDVPEQVLPALKEKGSKLPLDEIHNFNQRDRDRWVIAKAKTVPTGSTILDVGAGTCPYKQYFSHCNYKTHDFKKYHGVMLGNTTEYGKIDYESDINNIPVPDESFDVILCTEVLEHVPEPIRALEEMVRIVKPGGRIFLTAPLGSGLHQLPYHYYGGYTPEWYKHFAEKHKLTVNEIVPNGGYFRLLAQESARVSWTWDQHKHLHGDKAQLIYQLFSEWIPRYLFYLEDNCFIDQFTVGYHVELQKPVKKNTEREEKTIESKVSYDFRDVKVMLELAKSEMEKSNYDKAFRLALAVLAAEPDNQEAKKILSGE